MLNLFSALIAQTTSTNDVPKIKDLEGIVGNVISATLGLGAITVFIMLVVAGFKFLTSGGDPKATDSAKKTITFAIAGVVILALSYLLLVFIKNFTGVEVTKFNIRR